MDYIVDLRNRFHPGIRIILSLGGFSLCIELIYFLLNEIIKLKTKKDTLTGSPMSALKGLLAKVVKETRKFILYIQAYRFPKEVKQPKLETTHLLKLKEEGYRNWYWHLLDSGGNFIDCSIVSFDTRAEAKANAIKELKGFTILNSAYNNDIYILSIHAPHLLKKRRKS